LFALSTSIDDDCSKSTQIDDDQSKKYFILMMYFGSMALKKKEGSFENDD